MTSQRFFLLIFVICGKAFTNPHSHPRPRCQISSCTSHFTPPKNGRMELHGHGQMVATPSMLTNDGDEVTVSWSNVSYGTTYDWIGMFRNTSDISALFVPPIKYTYACAYGKVCPSGSVTFKLLNRRTSYVFAYVSGNSEYRELKGRSNPVGFKDVTKPMHVHLALGRSPKYVQVMWQQKEIGTPKIRWGTSPSRLTSSTTNVQQSTYEPNDFCDQDIGASAGLGGYFSPGQILSGFIMNLSPGKTYYYVVGDEEYGYTSVKNFTAPPAPGSSIDPTKGTRMLAFGDMGQVPLDFTHHHSWDWKNQGELFSINTTHMMTRMLKDYDFVLHIGDISYAVGFEAEWDNFMYQIEPVASAKPYMTGIGNHEMGHATEWTPPTAASAAYGLDDSGGECGVSYNSFFPFASVNPNSSFAERQPWYFFDYGTVRTVVMSTEHDFSKGSAQFNFLSEVLQGVDRSVTPWVVFAGHRPMYLSATWSGDINTMMYMQDQLEDLLYANKVALGLWGHQHSYSRTCPVYKGNCQKDGSGAIHLVIGMAGYELTRSIPSNPKPIFEMTSNKEYGFVIFDFSSRTSASGSFINAETGRVVEKFTFTNPYQG